MLGDVSSKSLPILGPKGFTIPPPLLSNMAGWKDVEFTFRQEVFWSLPIVTMEKLEFFGSNLYCLEIYTKGHLVVILGKVAGILIYIW